MLRIQYIVISSLFLTVDMQLYNPDNPSCYFQEGMCAWQSDGNWEVVTQLQYGEPVPERQGSGGTLFCCRGRWLKVRDKLA